MVVNLLQQVWDSSVGFQPHTALYACLYERVYGYVLLLNARL
jgi:hypothetical protein